MFVKRPRLDLLSPANVVIFFLLAMIWLVLAYFPPFGLPEMRLVARVSGYIAFVGMLVPYVHILRRTFRYRRWGYMRNWLRWHIAGAYTGFFFLILHSQGRSSNSVTLWINILVWVVMVSGVVGFYGQMLAYRILATAVDNEYGRERLEIERQRLLERGRVLGCKAFFQDWGRFYSPKSSSPLRRQLSSLLVQKSNSKSVEKAENELERKAGSSPVPVAAVLKSLQKADVDTAVESVSRYTDPNERLFKSLTDGIKRTNSWPTGYRDDPHVFAIEVVNYVDELLAGFSLKELPSNADESVENGNVSASVGSSPLISRRLDNIRLLAKVCAAEEMADAGAIQEKLARAKESVKEAKAEAAAAAQAVAEAKAKQSMGTNDQAALKELEKIAKEANRAAETAAKNVTAAEKEAENRAKAAADAKARVAADAAESVELAGAPVRSANGSEELRLPAEIREVPEAIESFCARVIEDVLAPPFSIWSGIIGNLGRKDVAENHFNRALQISDKYHQGIVKELWQLVETRRQMDLEYCFHAGTQAWLWFHAPAAWALLVFIVWHIASSIYYGGF